MNTPPIPIRFFSALLLLATIPGWLFAQEPIRLHPKNPHYFEFRGKPTILITSGEHYGAVLNGDFNYKHYLQTLKSYGFNQTRTFSGAYCEQPGNFGIENNTLAPLQGKLICPWARSDKSGYAGGGKKVDLGKWDEKYFQRLKDFLREADRQGVVVELVLFCPFYEESMWKLSPMNAANNVNGIGTMKRTEVYTLKHPKLLAVQKAMVAKIVTDLNEYDNLYYEICNEPYFGGVTEDWQKVIADTIVATEKKLRKRHLIAQNIANRDKKIVNPNPDVSIFNFHYAIPKAVTENYKLRAAFGDDETGFKGDGPTPYRIEAWEFMLAGGAEISNLDYSFICGKEDGSANPKAPGSRGPAIRKQLQILKEFLESFDFIRMRPDNKILKKVQGNKATALVLGEVGKAYAIYVRGQGKVELHLALPRGDYEAEWVDTLTGQRQGGIRLQARQGELVLVTPALKEDLALRIRSRN